MCVSITFTFTITLQFALISAAYIFQSDKSGMTPTDLARTFDTHFSDVRDNKSLLLVIAKEYTRIRIPTVSATHRAERKFLFLKERKRLLAQQAARGEKEAKQGLQGVTRFNSVGEKVDARNRDKAGHNAESVFDPAKGGKRQRVAFYKRHGAWQ